MKDFVKLHHNMSWVHVLRRVLTIPVVKTSRNVVKTAVEERHAPMQVCAMGPQLPEVARRICLAFTMILLTTNASPSFTEDVALMAITGFLRMIVKNLV